MGSFTNEETNIPPPPFPPDATYTEKIKTETEGEANTSWMNMEKRENNEIMEDSEDKTADDGATEVENVEMAVI